jgi:hypothetical protein
MFAAGCESLPMKMILFGSTGMIGQGVLRECPDTFKLLEP